MNVSIVISSVAETQCAFLRVEKPALEIRCNIKQAEE
jgi:hypothetical protein